MFPHPARSEQAPRYLGRWSRPDRPQSTIAYARPDSRSTTGRPARLRHARSPLDGCRDGEQGVPVLTGKAGAQIIRLRQPLQSEDPIWAPQLTRLPIPSRPGGGPPGLAPQPMHGPAAAALIWCCRGAPPTAQGAPRRIRLRIETGRTYPRPRSRRRCRPRKRLTAAHRRRPAAPDGAGLVECTRANRRR
jgi:hypothetical protein